MRTSVKTLRLIKKIALRVFLAAVGCMPVAWVYAEMCSLERECTITTEWVTYPDEGKSVIRSQDVSCGPWEEVSCRTPPSDGSSGGGSSTGGGSTGGGSCGSEGCGGGPATTDPDPPSPPPPKPDMQAQRCADCKHMCKVESAQLNEGLRSAVVDLGIQRCTEGYLPNGRETMKGDTMRECGTKHCKQKKIVNLNGVILTECVEYEQPEQYYCEEIDYPRDYTCVEAWAYGMPGETSNTTFNITGGLNLGKFVSFEVTPGFESGLQWNATDGLMPSCLAKANDYQEGCINGGKNWEGMPSSPCTVECNGL